MKNAHIECNLGSAYYLRSANPQKLDAPVSKSLLWDFNASPYKWRHSSGREGTKAMDLGTLIHSAILTPNIPLDQIASVSPYPDFRTKAAQEWRDDQREMGRIITTDADIRAASGCEQVFSEDYAQRFGVGYKSEVAVFAEIGATQIKGMIDLVPEGLDCLVDLKTTAKVGSTQHLENTIVNRGYHWQAALYLDLWNAATGENRDRFIFCFIETDEHHETAWIDLAPEFIEAGRIGTWHKDGRKKRDGYMDALSKWQACCATGIFPRQHEGITVLQKPAYL